jgi:hypothetical protein
MMLTEDDCVGREAAERCEVASLSTNKNLRRDGHCEQQATQVNVCLS